MCYGIIFPAVNKDHEAKLIGRSDKLYILQKIIAPIPLSEMLQGSTTDKAGL